MGAVSIWHWLIVLFWLVLFLVPAIKIVSKSGHSGWWALLLLVPIVNLIAIWIFAFKRWPVEQR